MTTEHDATNNDPQTSDPTAEAPASPPESTEPTGESLAGALGGLSSEAPTTAPAAAPRRMAPKDGMWWWGTGRRKTAVARVRIRAGKGDFKVNDRAYDEFFPGDRDQADLMAVLEKTNTRGTVDVFVNVRGGGITGQAGAIVLGLGRALRGYDPTLDSILRENGFLTRDAREVERKKYGQAGARRRFQFSKR